MAAAIRLALACVATLALSLIQSRGCGYTPDPLKGEGEPCTRSSECESHLTCSGGVCRVVGDFDAGDTPFDAGQDAGDDAGVDLDGAVDLDASAGDASTDAGLDDGAVGDAGADAAVADPDAG
ncbi:MAG: hypothetical protein KC619_09230 [Myxococcales bacterium]|nr:hypothetical protein [Myxococcales bacterium]